MNANEQILLKQIAWAQNRDIELIGSKGSRGRKTYTNTLDENLFQKLNPLSREEISLGDGGELNATDDRPAKMQALHSSSALGVNIFDYWRACDDLSVITSACGLSSRCRIFGGRIQFEQKFFIESRFPFAPNIDVVIYPDSGSHVCYAIECKFTEAYSNRGHGGIDPKYLEKAENWNGLEETKRLAEDISPEDHRFQILHAAQLIKHILGLSQRFRPGKFRLLYLYYDAYREDGWRHSQEIEDFTDIVRSDGVSFKHTTYQEVIARLAEYRDLHPDYVSYLTERYL